jgi:nitroreductase
MYAPSAGNEQAWQFIVLEGEMLKKYLTKIEMFLIQLHLEY